VPDSHRDSGRFTSAYWAELRRMRKDLKSYIVPPDQPANLSSGLSPKARRTMTNLDKEFLGKKTSSRNSKRTNDLREIKNILKKYDKTVERTRNRKV
jgi:hypothetical protein